VLFRVFMLGFDLYGINCSIVVHFFKFNTVLFSTRDVFCFHVEYLVGKVSLNCGRRVNIVDMKLLDDKLKFGLKSLIRFG
jgi:hypothetical protein